MTKVFHLDANRAELDVYAVGWKAYLRSGRPTSGGASASGATPSARPVR